MSVEKEEPTKDAALVAFWIRELAASGKQQKKWEDRAWKVVERYRDEKDRSDKRFNILYANTETFKPAVYAREPVPDIRNRNKIKDPIADQVAEVMERAAAYVMDAYEFDDTMSDVVEDYALPGRGIAKVDYVPTKGMVRPEVPVEPETIHVDEFTGEQTPIYPQETLFDREDIGPYILGEEEERIIDEEISCQYWFWEDFRHTPARKWKDVWWTAYRGRLTREELVKKYGDLGRKVPLDHEDTEEREKKHTPDDEKSQLKKATIWEIWDKRKKRRITIAESFKDRVLEDIEDPLNLSNFFPSPKPLIAVHTNDTLRPIPLYCVYQDQAEELDDVSVRISKLISQLKVRGIYNAVEESVEKMLAAGDGEYIPVNTMSDGKIADMVAHWPIEQIAQVVAGLYVQRDQIKQTIFEITGLSDILRGQTDAKETKGAQVIKSQSASMRLTNPRKDIQKFARDLIRMKVELIVEKFEPESITKMTQIPITPEMQELMTRENLRNYRIDIETDSTIELDAGEQQKAAVEVVTALTGMIKEFAPLVQAGILPVKVAKSLIGITIRTFKNARDLEEAVDSIGENPPEQKPDPEMMKVQALAQAKQGELQIKQQESQANVAIKQQETKADIAIKAQSDNADIQLQRERMQEEFAIKRRQMELEMELKRDETFERLKIDSAKAVHTGMVNEYKVQNANT